MNSLDRTRCLKFILEEVRRNGSLDPSIQASVAMRAMEKLGVVLSQAAGANPALALAREQARALSPAVVIEFPKGRRRT